MMKRVSVRRILLGSAALLTLAAAAIFPGCGGCGAGKAPLAFVPEDAVGALIIPSISGGVKEAKLLLDRFRDQQVVKLAIDQGKAELVNELGFDPENPQTLRPKGINPDGGLVVSLGADGKTVIAAVSEDDPKAMEKTLRELATKKAGGSAVFQEKEFSGVKVTLLTLQGSDIPRAGWAHVKKTLVLCGKAKEDKIGEAVAAAAKLERNIKSNKTFNTLSSKIGKHQVMLFIDGAAARKISAAQTEEKLRTASDWMKKYIREQQEATDNFLAYMSGVAFSMRLSTDTVALRTYFAATAEKGKTIQALLKGNGDAPSFGKYIGADALSVSRFSLNPKKLMDLIVETMPPGAKRSFYASMEAFEREAKVSPEKDIVATLSGRFAGAIFAPSADIIKAGPPRGKAGLLKMVPMVGMAQVSDPAKAAELLAKLERVLVVAGIEVRTRTEGDRKVYSIEEDGKPVVSWTVAKDVALIGTGDRVAKTVELIGGKGDAVLGKIDNSRAKGLLKSEDGALFYYSVARTADLINKMELPAEIKAILSNALSTINKFNDVMLDFEVDAEGILGELAVRMK